LQGIRYDGWLGDVRGIENQKNDKLAEWQRLDDMPINHFRFGGAINEFINEDYILIGDGGDIVSACAKVIDLTLPGQWLDPGPLGCLGVGAPFAIAAQHLYPEKKVLIINGDGSFGLNGFEFDTAVRFNLPIVSIVGNDAGWGQIRRPQVQMVGRERSVATTLAPTRYDKVVEALGGYGELVTEPGEIKAALGRAFAAGKPACVNVMLDPEGLAKTEASMPYVV
jgi:acetolactate synthase-1/2/3 large subunit